LKSENTMLFNTVDAL
jgi:hypothetical protein